MSASRARFAQVRACDAAGTLIVTPRPSPARLRGSILRILAGNALCSIATVTAGRRAHICHVYFCYSDDLDMYFLSHPRSLHCRNLTTNPSCAVTVFSSRQTWGRPDQGVQLFGVCAHARGLRARTAARLYGKRFPLYAEWKAGAEKDDPIQAYRFYRFVPTSLKVLDEKEFGARPGGLFVVAAIRSSPGARAGRAAGRGSRR